MIINGKAIADKQAVRVKRLAVSLRKRGIIPKLAVILVGNDEASKIYVRLKSKRAAEAGVETKILKFEETIGGIGVIGEIRELNADETVHGILVQLPLPSGLHPVRRGILDAIAPKKDVDGLTRKGKFLPATVRAVLVILKEAGFGGFRGLGEFGGSGKTVVVVGQGDLVGKPLADYLEKQKVKVIRCDEFTKDLKSETLKGDVLVVATGVPNLIKADMVKPGAIVIDCGSPKPEVDPAAAEIAGAITPVPGGVGPLTVVSLLENVLAAAG